MVNYNAGVTDRDLKIDIDYEMVREGYKDFFEVIERFRASQPDAKLFYDAMDDENPTLRFAVGEDFTRINIEFSLMTSCREMIKR